MIPFDCLVAIAAPLRIANVDTDMILPARFLTTISRSGLKEGLFWTQRQDPNFVLNRKPWSEAGIIVTLENFGCGSSREHAPWALLDFGIRCIIAPSIADIFYNNCCKNGILPVVLARDEVERLLGRADNPDTAEIEVDLAKQEVRAGTDAFAFDIAPTRKADLLAGTDDIVRSLKHAKAIARYEAEIPRWLPQIMPDSFAISADAATAQARRT